MKYNYNKDKDWLELLNFVPYTIYFTKKDYELYGKIGVYEKKWFGEIINVPYDVKNRVNQNQRIRYNNNNLINTNLILMSIKRKILK